MNISWHYIFTPDNIWWGGGGGGLYRDIIFSLPTIFGGGDYIVTVYFHPWQYLVKGWIYCDIIFSLLTIFGEGVIILWHYIFTPVFGQGVIISWHYIYTPDNIWSGGDYIVTLYLHSWQYLVRGWLYRDIIFSHLTIFGQGVIISWHYIFTHWQYLVRGWLYCDIIFSLLTIFSAGVIISWHYIFTADNNWSGGDYIMTQYSHPWQYQVRGWLYRAIIFSLLTIFREGVIISWHDILTPDNIWSGGDYIVTLYFHSWQYLVRGWLYCDIIFSLLTISGEGVIISWHIFTPEDIWWGGDYIVTLQYNFWHYPRIWHWRWLYLNIVTFQIWLCSDTRVLLFIFIYSPHETWEDEVIIFKHNTLFAVETQCFGGYVNGLYQQSVINKNL